jgi:hypothetical protein
MNDGCEQAHKFGICVRQGMGVVSVSVPSKKFSARDGGKNAGRRVEAGIHGIREPPA